jgi:hypothetical protein
MYAGCGTWHKFNGSRIYMFISPKVQRHAKHVRCEALSS